MGMELVAVESLEERRLGGFQFSSLFFRTPGPAGGQSSRLFDMHDLIHAGVRFASIQGGFADLFPTVSSTHPSTLMKKKTDVVSGLVSEEHPFHQALTQPGKAKKHRYERRKVRSILKVGDWGEEIEYEDAS